MCAFKPNSIAIRTHHVYLRPLLGGIITVFLIAIGIAFRNELIKWIRIHPTFFPLFVFVAQVLFVPRIVTLVLSGILFPTPLAVTLTLVGDTSAAIVVWVLGHWSFFHIVENQLVRPEFVRVRKFLTHRAPLISVAVLRMLPVSHFSTVSMLSGVLGISFTAFFVGTIIGCFPTALFWALAGATLS